MITKQWTLTKQWITQRIAPGIVRVVNAATNKRVMLIPGAFIAGMTLFGFILLFLAFRGCSVDSENDFQDTNASPPTPEETASPVQPETKTNAKPKIFEATVFAEATSKATAQCNNGTIVEATGYGQAEAMASSTISAEDARQKARQEANTQAQAKANANAHATCSSTSSPQQPVVAPPPSSNATPIAAPTLSVKLLPTPTNDSFAPINGLSVQVTVSGTATGQIAYRFDCDNDGVPEKTRTNFTTGLRNQIVTWSIPAICYYKEPRIYQMKILVERQGLTAEGFATIVARPRR